VTEPVGKEAHLIRVAFHEAGHAVASVQLHRPFKYVTNQPSGDSQGHMMGWRTGKWFRPDIEITSRVRTLIDAEVSVLLAGAIAERRFTGRSNHVGAKSDYDVALNLASYIGGSERQSKAYVKWRHTFAEDLIESRWNLVEAVARALAKQKRMTFDDVRNLVFPQPKFQR